MKLFPRVGLVAMAIAFSAPGLASEVSIITP